MLLWLYGRSVRRLGVFKSLPTLRFMRSYITFKSKIELNALIIVRIVLKDMIRFLYLKGLRFGI